MARARQGHDKNFGEGTLGEYLHYLVPRLGNDETLPLRWPPDVFGLAAAVLNRTGGYASVLSQWPPRRMALHTWCDLMTELGRAWRQRWLSRADPPAPDLVVRWWQQVLRTRTIPLADLSRDHGLCRALLQLVACSEATPLAVPALFVVT
jgi:hypothetical protein